MNTQRMSDPVGRNSRRARQAMRRPIWLSGLPLSLIVAFVSATAGAAPILTVDPASYVLVSSTPFGRNRVDYSYTAEVVNSGSGAQGVSAIARQPATGVRIVEGNLSFGDVGPGERKRSTDTFTIRRDPSAPFDPLTAVNWRTSFTSRSNEPPVADAGADQSVFQGATVTLNGSASTDPDGDELRYRWSFVSKPRGSRARLDVRRVVAPTFVADVVGIYELQLIVNDRIVDSAPDTVVVTTETVNATPVANAGADQSVRYGATVQLNGTGSSDADGDPLSFSWTFVSRPTGSAAALIDAAGPTPTFVADAAGDFVLSLVVNDGRVNSAPDTVIVTTSNSAPVADAGADQTVAIGALVTLDGSASSDADGNLLSYAWSLLSRPTTSSAVLLGADSSTPSFAADANGDYVVQLIVNDGLADSEADTVLISTINSAPVANAGPDQTVRPGDTVTLDGNASSDSDNDPLSFDWALTVRPDGSSAALDLDNYPIVQFTADLAGLYVAQLIVNDGRVASDPDTAQVTARDNVPTAVPDTATTPEDAAVLIDVLGNDTDPLGGTLTPEVTASPMHGTAIVQGSGILYTPTADYNGSDSFSYRVSNAEATSSAALVSVTVTPVNDPPVAVDDAASTGAGAAVVIDVLANDSDVDGDSLTITAVGVPGNGAASTDGVTITYTPDAGFSGEDSFSYTISDGSLESTANVSVTVNAPTDQTAPVIAPNVTGTQGSNGWYTSNVSVSWTVTDPESPIDSQSGCDAVSVTVDTADTTFTCTATSAGGTSTESVTIRRDATAPSVTIVTPADAAAYPQGQTVVADYACTDAQAGVETCAGPVASGGAVDTATTGARSFAVTATDAAGNTATVTHNYTVTVVVPPVVAGNDSASTNQGEAVSIAVLGNDSGGGGPLSVSAVTQGTNGSVAIDGASVTYTPEANFFGTDSFTYTVTDGLTSAIGTVTVTVNEAVDASPPVITPNVVGTLGGDGWYVSGVEVTWTVEDPESAIDSSTGCERVYVIEDTAGRTLTCTATSAGGPASESVTIRKDASAPAIRFPTPPPGAGYYLGQIVEADYECTDVGAGVATCEGTTADGAAIDTSTLGEKTFEVTGTDAAGNAQTFTRKYNVVNRGEVIITTAAGGGPIDSVAALESVLGSPQAVAVDAVGNQYVAATDLNQILRVDPSGIVTAVAGNGAFGFSGDGGAATAAGLANPSGVAVDLAGNLYIADRNNNRIRKVDSSGTITTVAGTGTSGFSGDGGAATAAGMSAYGIAVDAEGNLYIADRNNNRIRKVDSSGTVTTVAGNGSLGFAGDGGAATAAGMSAYGVAVDAAENLYIADSSNRRIRKVDSGGMITTLAGNGSLGFAGDGGAATAAGMNPVGVAADAAGNLYIADLSNQRIRKVDAGGTITTVAGNGTAGYSGDGGAATAAGMSVYGIAVDAAGNLYIVDSSNQRIRKVDAVGTITTVAGNGVTTFSGEGGAATAARLFNPFGVAADAAGNLYIADSSNQRVRKVDAAGTITTVAGSGVFGFSGDGGAATAAGVNPYRIAVDAAGNLYIADQGNHRIRRVDAAGTITTVAGSGAFGFSGDGGAATAARLFNPSGVAVDATGNLYIADTNNQRIRKVHAGGTITTVAGNGTLGFSGDGGVATAARLANPFGVAVDAAGNLYVADTSNRRIRKVDAAGMITTVAGNGSLGFSGDGGSATTASLGGPSDVAVDAAGNLYIADRGNRRIRQVDAGGTITSVAGNGTVGYSGDGGAATAASFADPVAVAVEAAGNLYIADLTNQRIRRFGPAGGYVDATPPSVVANVTGTEGTNDWYTSDVAVTWTVTDPDSPITSQTGCEQQSVTADTDSVTFTCSATSAGGTSTESVTIKRDATPPVVQLFAPANDATFEQDAVVNADYGCDDTLSGIATCSGPVATGAAIDTATAEAKNFAVTATDAAGNTTTVTHNYTVSESTPPVDAIDDVATTPEDQPITIAVLANDTGGGGPLSITAVTQGANGAVSIVGVNAVYTPNANFNGSDAFTYTASDGTTSDSASVTVTVEPVNDPPVAVDDSASTAQGVAVTVAVLANDTDVEGDSLSVAAVSERCARQCAIVGRRRDVHANRDVLRRRYVYVHRVGRGGYGHRHRDGHGDADPAGGSRTTRRRRRRTQPVTVAVLDNDAGNNLSVTAVTQGAHGAVTTDGATATYTPEDQYNGPDTFTYTVTDGIDTATASVSVTVTPGQRQADRGRRTGQGDPRDRSGAAGR